MPSPSPFVAVGRELAQTGIETAADIISRCEFKPRESDFQRLLRQPFAPQKAVTDFERLLRGEAVAFESAEVSAATAVASEGAATMLSAAELAAGLLVFGFAVHEAVVSIDEAAVSFTSRRLGVVHGSILGVLVAAGVSVIRDLQPDSDFWPDSDISDEKRNGEKRWRRMERVRVK